MYPTRPQRRKIDQVKNIAALLLLFCGLMTAIRLFENRFSTAQQSPACSFTNPRFYSADFDSSGDLTLTDVVGLARFLFASGPEPPCSSGSRVRPTGQAKCYDDEGNEVSCTESDCLGQDGFYQQSCPSKERYIDNQDGTVTDTWTGLMWLKENGNDGNRIQGWCNALAYCENLEFAGYSDWRLPNIRELISIVDYGRGRPALDPVFTVSNPTGTSLHWSSTSAAIGTYIARIVTFGNGSVGGQEKDDDGLVRPVRTIQ